MGHHCSNGNRENLQAVSNLKKFADNYDWSGLKFLASSKEIGLFETKNAMSVNLLVAEEREIYIC